MKLWDDKVFYKALFFAEQAHRGQLMKHPENMPYSAHFVGVCANALKYAVKDKKKTDYNLLVQVALLHDTIEDTNASYEDVKNEFGEAVANGVLALSKNKAVEKKDQMRDCIERIKKQPREVAIVKLADRLFNIRDRVPTWSEQKQLAYKQEAELICKELGYASKSLKKSLIEAIENY